MDGFDELEKQLDKMQKNAEELEDMDTIPFTELFTVEFMREYTIYSTFDELLEAGGFEVNSEEDFNNIPDDKFDEHIASSTQFNKWEDMLSEAGTHYITNKLGF